MALEATPAAGEQDLLARLRAGEERAYEELVRSYGGRMLGVARRFLPVEEDARDAVQDAFLSAFRSIDRFEGHAQLSTWLHRIVVNASLMKLRTRRRKPEQSIEELLPGYLDDGHFERPASPWRSEELDPAEQQELRKLVMRSIHSLPEGHRNVLLLRDIEDLDTAEVAELLQISPGAVKTRLHRARQALRELLEPHLREAPPS
jgi:RNA polymerase sigma-70 factor (ECF subfamily)